MVLKQNGKTGRVADIDSHNPLERSSFHTGEATLSAEQLAEKQALEQTGGSSKQKSKLLLILAAMGPGIVTAMAGNDAGGISTYSTVGAQFGFATLWVIPIMCVLLIVVEMTAAKMGAVTGKGFAALIRESFGIRLTALAMFALLIGNVCTTFSEFAGIASGMEMFGVSKYIAVPVAAISRLAAHRRRQLQARGEGVPHLVAGVPYLRDRGVLGAAELGGCGYQHHRSPCGVPAKLRFTGHIHDRHHHCALDDVLQPEQRG